MRREARAPANAPKPKFVLWLSGIFGTLVFPCRGGDKSLGRRLAEMGTEVGRGGGDGSLGLGGSLGSKEHTFLINKVW